MLPAKPITARRRHSYASRGTGARATPVNRHSTRPTHSHSHTHARSHAGTHTRTHAHTHTHTHTVRAALHTRAVRGRRRWRGADRVAHQQAAASTGLVAVAVAARVRRQAHLRLSASRAQRAAACNSAVQRAASQIRGRPTRCKAPECSVTRARARTRARTQAHNCIRTVSVRLLAVTNACNRQTHPSQERAYYRVCTAAVHR
jgi:hypothetical protein